MTLSAVIDEACFTTKALAAASPLSVPRSAAKPILKLLAKCVLSAGAVVGSGKITPALDDEDDELELEDELLELDDELPPEPPDEPPPPPPPQAASNDVAPTDSRSRRRLGVVSVVMM